MKYLIGIVIIVVLSLYFFLPASNDKDASAKIDTVLNNLVRSAERKDLNVVMEYFSPDYSDSSGRTITDVRNIIQNAFDRFDTINSGYANLIVSTIEDDNGNTQTLANIDIWISGSKDGNIYKLIGTEDNPKNVEIMFESLMLGGWKILSVEGIK